MELSNSRFAVRSFVQSLLVLFVQRKSSNSSGINLHKAPSRPHIAWDKSHCIRPHCMTLHLHYITIHCTTHQITTSSTCFCQPVACLPACPASLVSAVVSASSARLYLYLCLCPSVPLPVRVPIPIHTQTQTQFTDLGQTSLVPTVPTSSGRSPFFPASFLPSFCSLRCLPPVLHPKASWSNPARSSTPPPPGCVCRP